MTPSSGIDRISCTSSTVIISPRDDPPRIVAGQQQVEFDRRLVALGAPRARRQDADDAVAVAHRGDFRVGDDDRRVGEIQRRDRAVLDAGRAVADDVVELLPQLFEHALDALALQRILVARLRGREDVEIVVALVLDQRLIEVGVTVDDIDEVEDDAPLATHDQIEVAQPDIEIDHNGPVAAQSQPGGEGGRTRGLADPALARCNYHDFRQGSSPAQALARRAAGAGTVFSSVIGAARNPH